MFKLESYITPLILSYVDKYVKNLKPEDSQVSLWGGDAVFSNLDLRLDVLEKELCMPFSFVNGHIHELRIHVPWTKLGSEPVVITINTIECILKLYEGCSSSTDGSGSVRSGSSLKVRGEPKIVGKRTEAGTPIGIPPNYVQSLVNRVLNNITIICNNVILKYVEDDIVLSLNVKSAEAFSADEKWQQAFVDLSLPELVLRKLVRLQDLTVCLDRRNASGKITTYQDPLLYRCSLDCRLYMTFESLHAKHLLATKLDVLCEQLDFSITEHQVPMFLRLIELCLALHANEISTPEPPTNSGDDKSQLSQELGDSKMIELEEASQKAGWGAWMWSYIPTGFVGWSEDEEDSSLSTHLPSSVFHLGFYIQQASFVFKIVEPSDGSFNMQKITFLPLCSLLTEGVFIDIMKRGIDVFNCQMGIIKVWAVISGNCCCGVDDCSESLADLEENKFFITGIDQPANTMKYFAGSLFDEEAVENQGHHREYCFEWDEHFIHLSNIAMQSRSPAFAMDYFYLLEIPEELSDKSSGFSFNDLECSNLKERAVNRIIVGPAMLYLSSGVCHRMGYIMKSTKPYDYVPYSKPNEDLLDETSSFPAMDEMSSLEKFVPSRQLNILVIKPTVKLFLQIHPSWDFTVSTTKSVHRNRCKLLASSPVNNLPVIVIHGEVVDLRQQCAMYPCRVVKAASLLKPPSDHLLYNSHAHFNIELLQCGSYILSISAGVEIRKVLISPCDLSVYRKRLLLPSYWKNHMQPKIEYFYKMHHIELCITMAQVLLLKMFFNSWFNPAWKVQQILDTSVIHDNCSSTNTVGKLILMIAASGIEMRMTDTSAVCSYAGVLGTFQIFLQCPDLKHNIIKVPILYGPEEKSSQAYLQSFFTDKDSVDESESITVPNCLNFTVQLPKNSFLITVPVVFVLSSKAISLCLDPRIFEWFAYQPHVYFVPRARSIQQSKQVNENKESKEAGLQGSGLSSVATTLPTESKTKSQSVTASATEKNVINNGYLRGITDLITDQYSVLQSLCVQIEIEGCCIILSKLPIPWTASSCRTVATEVRSLFLQRFLPDAIVIHSPRLSIINGNQKRPNLLGNQNIPILGVEGWCLGSDHFPWAVQVDHYSIITLLHSQLVQYCLSPGMLSATVAVSSKYSPITSLNITQLNICIHCDFQPIQFHLSHVQAELIAELIQNYLRVLPNLVILINSDNGYVAERHLFYPEASIPGTSVLPPHVDAKGRKISGTSSQRESGLVAAFEHDGIDTKVVVTDLSKPSNVERVKVSVWLQTTLPKLSLDLIGCEADNELCLRIELEDVSSSVDVQEVYSKVKLKVASLNATNFLKKTPDSEWELGPHEGITFCCGKRLTKTVYLPNPKTGVKCVYPHGSFYDQDDLQQSHGSFLLFTFTRAQCKNVQKRWAKILRDCSNSELGGKLHDMSEKSSGSSKIRHVSEIDVKVLSFDCVFWTPLVLCIIRIFQPITSVVLPYLSSATIPSNLGCNQNYSPSCATSVSSESDDTLPLFSTLNLPLVYFSSNTIRIFFPSSMKDTKLATSKERPFQNLTKEKNDKTCIRNEDLIILQVGSINMTPNVDNPLSRLLLKPDIYNIAQHAGILMVPGAEIEDRQYQLDVTNLSLNTGSWDEIVNYTKSSVSSSEVAKVRTMGENPAVAWNTKLDSCDNVAEVIFMPVVSQFNLRVVAAPAIVYKKGGHLDEGNKVVLVAAHSLEINATTNIEFFIGFHQLALLQEQIMMNLHLLNSNSSKNPCLHSSLHKGQEMMMLGNSGKEIRDSGIDSEASTFGHLLLGIASPAPITAQQNPVSSLSLPDNTLLHSSPAKTVHEATYTPFEILLTASRITVAVYSPKHLLSIPDQAKLFKESKCAHATKTSSMEGVTSFKSNARKRSNLWQEEESTSTEGSPVRLIKEQAKKSCSQETEFISELAGYEGSEESLEEGLLEENSDLSCSSGYNIVPLFYLVVSQPYSFLKCHKIDEKLELSCFDINLKGTSSKIPIMCTFPIVKPEVYDVFWFETLPGDSDPKTGIPPALYTLTIKDFFKKPSIYLKLERPLKINFNTQMQHEIMSYFESLKNILCVSELTSVNMDHLCLKDAELEKNAKEVSFEAVCEKYRCSFTKTYKIACQTQQMVFSLKADSSSTTAQILININKSSTDLEFRCNENNLMQDAVAEFSFDGCLLQTKMKETARTMIGPMSFVAGFTAVWEDWNISSPVPNVTMKLVFDMLLINIDQEHLKCLSLLMNNFICTKNLDNSNQTMRLHLPPFVLKSCKTSSQYQTWQDDLRIGIFQYTQDADDIGLMPSMNEIVFCKEHGGHPASMTWRYPQPRVLTRTEVHPVPFRAASETLIDSDSSFTPTEVQCALQYWDSLHLCFVTYRVFHLSETQHCILDLPFVAPENYKDLVASHTWRVVMDYSDSDEVLDNLHHYHRGLVSPLALAACMRVDSCFDSVFFPFLDSLISFDVVKITFSNHFPQSNVSKCGIPILMPYELDGSMPVFQEFLILSLENISLRCRHWHQTCKLEVEVIVRVDFLDYKFLTLKSLIEPVLMNGQVSIIKDNDKPTVAEGSISLDAVFLHLEQSAIHTLSSSIKTWKEEEESRSQFLMNSYIICNETQDLLRFGQVDTDENIALQKYQAHAYSWRTFKAKQVLHVCIEGMKWKWCEPFNIDDTGIQVRIIENKLQKATLIIKVEQLNNMQKQVIIGGQLVIANRMMHHLEVRLKCSKPRTMNTDNGASEELFSDLPDMSCAPSFIIQHECSWNMQVRLAGSSNCWSEMISIGNSIVPNEQLITLPVKDSSFPLNLWCHVFSYSLGNALRKVVMLCPLYIVRSHLPVPLYLEIATPALSHKHSMNIDGKGHEHQIYCPGDPTLTHHLSFRLAPELELSNPSLPLSPAMISQTVKKPPFNMVSKDNFYNDWDSPWSYIWPYDCEELEKEIEQLPPSVLSSLKSERQKLSHSLHFYQPNIDLDVSLIQRWPGCQSLLIDVKPWGLLINQSGIDIILHHKDDVLIPENAVFALPKLEGTFKLGISYMGRIYYSNNVEQSPEDWSLNRYWPKVSGVLSRNGHVLCRIAIDTPVKLQVCYLTVCAREREGIRIFSIRPYYTLVNTTESNLLVTGFAVSRTGPKIKLNSDNLTAVTVKRNRAPTPILYWDVETPPETSGIEMHDDDDYIHYLKFCCLLNEQHHSAWSLSVPLKKLKNSDPECISSVVVSTMNEQTSTEEGSNIFHLTLHHYKGSIFLIISNGKPNLKLYNNCSFPLFYGQGISKLVEVTDFVVYEESYKIEELPLLQPQGTSYYTFPVIMEKFPEMYDPKMLPKLHLAKAVFGCDGHEIMWSSGIDILATSDQFLSIPNCGDVKVHIEKTIAATHIFLDPVNRVEVSAKEIRSRIKMKDSPERSPLWRRPTTVPHKQKSLLQPDKAMPPYAKHSDVSDRENLLVSKVNSGNGEKHISKLGNEKDPLVRTEFHDRSISDASATATPLISSSLQMKSIRNSTSARFKDKLLCYFMVHLKHVCIIVLNETAEVIRMVGDELYFMTRPLLESSSTRQNSTALSHQQELLICIGNMQLDNQLHSLGGHDFPVILISQCNYKSIKNPSEPSVACDLSQVRRESLIMGVIIIQQPVPESSWYPEDVELIIKPLAVYFEDSLVYSLLQLIEKCDLSCPCSWSKDILLKDRTVPQEVWIASENMTSSISLQRFFIHPVSLMFSLHASLKLFISLDHTPLSFREFQRCQFSTTWYRLGHALTMHYLSGALIRAGWVLGSMDLLANPGGFARSVSTGMADFFRLPYRGLMHGPWAFIMGISQGSSSLFRHITSGTLVSVTNLASSISRNMDRLSLDRGHLERNEELRRCPPVGFTIGLTQGLTGLGISLLGAIAGIVDQPLQSVQGTPSEILSPTAAAASIISGVGKGLVGVVTKPIGGAAEFVAQAGQGILHGTGWTRVLKRRYAASCEELSSDTNSSLKYLWKMLPESNSACVFALDATHINSSGNYVAAVLLLTPEALFVVSVESDMQQQAFSVTELDCRGHNSDPTLVYFVPHEDDSPNYLQPEEKNRDRITEFISKSSKYTLGNQKADETESLSDTSSHPSQAVGTHQTTMVTRFYVNPRLRSTFLVLYQMTQRKLLRKGYPM